MNQNSWMLKSPEFMTPEYNDIISRLKNDHIITEDGYFSAFPGTVCLKKPLNKKR